ncbi:PAS domain S-box protein, partial [Dokdonella sp.]|uniref:PAS domain-containing protein n=1 Tax=Dokdonella sp. TaxID=2291710 RepID=UPI003C3C6BDE
MKVDSIPLRILMVEDSRADTDLILHQLRDMPRSFVHTRVANESDLRKALTEFEPDVILSDFRMPGFSGQEALKLALALAPGTPFLFVSGTIGEELAIDTLQNGAMDYVLKDNLRRLPNAIERALDIAQSRRERDHMERALRDSEERFRAIVESSNDWIWERDSEARTTYSNSAVSTILGFGSNEVLGIPAIEFMMPEDRQEATARLALLTKEGRGWQGWRQRWCHRDGSTRTLESRATPLLDDHGKVIGFRGIDHDISDRLNHEAQIRHLARIHAVLGSLGNAVLRSGSRDQLLQQMCEVAVEKGGFAAACISQLSDDRKCLNLTHSSGN